MEEQWKPIPGFEGYEVSDCGRVRSYWRPGGPGFGAGYYVIDEYPQRIMSTAGRSTNRYPVVTVGGKTHTVHRLVMLAFVGPCPDGLIVCHNDDNPENNHLSNLRYGTYQSNTADAWESGNLSSEVLRRLDADQVRDMRRMAARGATAHELAELFDICASTASAICRGVAPAYSDIGGQIVDKLAIKPKKLSAQQIREIRRKLASGVVGRDLAYQYDVSESMISRIKSGERRSKRYGGTKTDQD